MKHKIFECTDSLIGIGISFLLFLLMTIQRFRGSRYYFGKCSVIATCTTIQIVNRGISIISQ